MNGLKKILAICGSTRRDSSNHHLIEAIINLFAADFQFVVYTSLAEIVAFNPDISRENHPSPVLAFRNAIREADAVLICTPEYAHGVPGALKNALDWTVGSGEFSGKPTALITASTDGRYAHRTLLEILRTIDAKNVNQHQLLIRFIQSRLNSSKEIIHEPTIEAIRMLFSAFKATIDQS